MATTYLTKSQRKNLIEEYLECAEDMGDDSQTFESLNAMGNVDLINTCVAFMPDCMENL